MTATLDLLERRGWIRRIRKPGDRRSVLIEITPDGRAAADQLLPGIRAIERSILSALPRTNEHSCLTCSPRFWPGPPKSPQNNPNPSRASASGRPDSTAPGKAPEARPPSCYCLAASSRIFACGVPMRAGALALEDQTFA